MKSIRFRAVSIVFAALFLLLLSGCSAPIPAIFDQDEGQEAEELVVPLIKTGTFQQSIEHDGEQRSYILFVPEAAAGIDPIPVVLNFHGFTGTAESQMNYADFRPLAETHGFILVYPEGTLLNGRDTHWNVGGWTRGSSADDIGFVLRLIDRLDGEYGIDRDRIYATGHSNGGYMSILLACTHSEAFAAVASMAGSMTPEMMRGCDPTRPVPLLQIHGTADDVVPYGGTSWSEPVEETLTFWIEHNETAEEPEVIEVPASEFTTADSSIEIYRYNTGNSDSIVEHIKVLGGGHEWLGRANGVGQVNLDLMLNEEIWAFFSQYDLNGEREE